MVPSSQQDTQLDGPYHHCNPFATSSSRHVALTTPVALRISSGERDRLRPRRPTPFHNLPSSRFRQVIAHCFARPPHTLVFHISSLSPQLAHHHHYPRPLPPPIDHCLMVSPPHPTLLPWTSSPGNKLCNLNIPTRLIIPRA